MSNAQPKRYEKHAGSFGRTDPCKLTAREQLLLDMARGGMSSADIARTLKVKARSMSHALHLVAEKLGYDGIRDAAAHGWRGIE